MIGIVILILVVLVIISKAVYVFREYERGVLFRLGRLVGVRGPGLVLIIPFIDRLVRVSLRIVTMDVPPQDVITKDNVSVKVNAVVYYRVFQPDKAIVVVEDYNYATSQLAQTTLRSVLGSAELDELLSARDKINMELQAILDRQTDAWGIKVTVVEVKHVDLPENMQRAIARQAEAERERRAKVIHAEGELQASQSLQKAASVLASEPVSVQLRYFQTLNEIAVEKNSTIIFPVPIDLIELFLKKVTGKAE
jgi:regulator of protease activity HflC (stomatin/prohibitin superfamily)